MPLISGARKTVILPRRIVVASNDAAQTTAFLARTSGLSGTETSAYKTLINGLVADNIWNKLDALYIFATNTTTTANLNLKSTSFGLTANGTVSFTADHGYTGGGAGTDFLSTGFIPSTSGTTYTLNSASFGAYVLTNRTTVSNITTMGVLDGTGHGALLQLFSFGNNNNMFPNQDAADGVAATTSQGFWAVTRTSSAAGGAVMYRNGSGTAILTGTQVSTTLPSQQIYILGLNNNGTAAQNNTDQTAAAFMGGGLISSDYVKLQGWINGYMTSLGVNVY